MRLRDRAVLLASLFVVGTLFVVAVVGLTGRTLNIHVSGRIGTIRLGPFWSQDFYTVLGESRWGVEENIVICSPSPQKDMRFPRFDGFQVRKRYEILGYLKNLFRSENDVVLFRLRQIVKICALRTIGHNCKVCLIGNDLTWGGATVRPTCAEVVPAYLLPLRVENFSHKRGHPGIGDKCSFRTLGGLVDRLVNVPYQVREQSQYSGEYGSPHACFADKQESPYPLKHIWNFLLCIVSIPLFIGCVGSLRHGLESNNESYLLLAIVLALLWYCAVSSITTI